MTSPKSSVDRISRWYLDRRLFIQEYLEDRRKARAPNRGMSIATAGERPDSGEMMMSTGDTKNARVAMTTSWIYSDVQTLMAEVGAAELQIYQVDGEQDKAIRNHPFELLWNKPNRFLGRTFIMQYLTAWLMLDGNAYWFLSPSRRNRDELVEIWPLDSSRMKAVKDENRFISHYLYKLDKSTVVRFDPSFIAHFMLTNPFDQINGLSKLTASNLPMETDLYAAKFQNAFYKTGSGVPRSVLSLDRDISERDFIAVEAKIQEDFVAGGKTIAIVRGGEFDVKTVGISQNDMQLIDSRSFTRDEIDRIYLGVEYNSLKAADAVQEADRLFREKGVYPLHRLIADVITLQIISRFYGENYKAVFDDVRLRDRSIEVQEAAVYWRVMLYNEARVQRGLPPLEGKIGPIDLSEVGKLPLALANDPVFLMTLFEMAPPPLGGPPSGNTARGRENSRRSDRAIQDDTASVPAVTGLQSPSVATTQLSRSGVLNKDIELIKDELKTWYKVSRKEFSKGNPPGSYPFVSEFIDPAMYKSIKDELFLVVSLEGIKEVFDRTGYSRLEEEASE